MKNYKSLQNLLLIAMPSLGDPNFFHSVVYLCECNEQNAMGIIVNKPRNINLGNVLEHLKIPIHDKRVYHYPVLEGGPVSEEQGFIVSREHRKTDAGEQITEISVSASKDDLTALANGEGLDDAFVALGHAGWGAGQLEEELANNMWLVCPLNELILFEVPLEQRWQRAAALIGVDMNRLSPDVGHA